MADNSKSAGLILVIVALVIGGGAGFMLGKNKDEEKHSQSASQTTDVTMDKAAGLRVLLNNLEAQHVDLASTATRAGFDGDAQFPAAAGALDANSKALSNAIASVYGEEAGNKFYEIWASHIGFFVDYTKAAKAGDQAGMDKAVQNLNGYVEAISSFLSSANPNLPKEAVASLVTEHVGLLKGAVDKYGAGDYAGSFESQQQAREQITTKIADTLSGAIIKQKPEAFQN
jgi:hypothetical protein